MWNKKVYLFFGKRNKVTGVDLLNVVKEKYHNFNFQIADATNLPFQSNTFDLVISFDVIEHIENDKRSLQGIEKWWRDISWYSK